MQLVGHTDWLAGLIDSGACLLSWQALTSCSLEPTCWMRTSMSMISKDRFIQLGVSQGSTAWSDPAWAELLAAAAGCRGWV